MKDQRLEVTVENDGDISVGISPSVVRITIESDINLTDVFESIKYKDNVKPFSKNILDIAEWVDDMKSYITDIRLVNKGEEQCINLY